MSFHAYDPTCPCNYCGITAWHLNAGTPKTSVAKAADVVPLPPKKPGEVIYIDFKSRKRVK